VVGVIGGAVVLNVVKLMGKLRHKPTAAAANKPAVAVEDIGGRAGSASSRS
jgi:hypothetical protein